MLGPSLHFLGFHDGVTSVEPSVGDEGKEEESGVAKLGRPIVLEREADAANEGGLSWVEALESLIHHGTGDGTQGAQGVLNRFILVSMALIGQVEVMV